MISSLLLLLLKKPSLFSYQNIAILKGSFVMTKENNLLFSFSQLILLAHEFCRHDGKNDFDFMDFYLSMTTSSTQYILDEQSGFDQRTRLSTTYFNGDLLPEVVLEIESVLPRDSYLERWCGVSTPSIAWPFHWLIPGPLLRFLPRTL